MKNTLQVLRDLAGVLVGAKKQCVIDVTEQSKPALEAFLSDVHRKYSTRKKRKEEKMLHIPPTARRLNPVRGKTKLTLDITLKLGREQIRRKVTVNYPKKLYPFELKEEIAAFIVGIKTMVRVVGEFQKEARPKVRLHRPRKLKRRRRSGPQLALHT